MAKLSQFKIVFAGLANSGKTSILLNLKREYHGEILPTKGIERSEMKVLGYTLIEWDLGGQSAFRKSYLQRKDTFGDTNILYYVIDIHDSQSFEEAFDYFHEIIEIFRETNQTPKIVICFHKIDLHLSPEMNKSLRDRFESIAEGFDLKFFATTIFNTYSLINAFSYGLRELSGQTTDLIHQLQEFAELTSSEAIILMESNGFVIGEYFAAGSDKITHLTRDLNQNIIIPFISTKFNEKISNILDRIIIELHPGFFIFEPIRIADFNMYVIRFTISAENAIQKYILQPMVDSSEKMKKIIEYFFL